jgi:hypothetical protein
MNEPEVIRQDAPIAPGADKAKGGKDETVTLTKAEHASLVRERNEAIESERYWSRNRAGEKAAPAVEAEPEIHTDDLLTDATGNADVDEAIFSDPDKWAEAISKGPKAIEAFVRRAGFVTRAETVEIASKAALRTVNLEKQRMAGDTAIISEFPELNNPKSELFIATTEEVRRMVRMDPGAAKSPATLYAAAKVAKLTLDAAKAATRRTAPDDDESDDERYDRVEREDDRRSRSDAQDTSRNRGRRESSDDTDMLGDQAKEVLRLMGGVTEDEFRAERKKLGNAPRRR